MNYKVVGLPFLVFSSKWFKTVQKFSRIQIFDEKTSNKSNLGNYLQKSIVNQLLSTFKTELFSLLQVKV